MKSIRWMFGVFLMWSVTAFGANELSYKWPDGQLHFSTGDLTVTSVGPENWEAAFATGGQRWNDVTTVNVTTDNTALGATCETSGPNSAFFAADFCGQAWGSTTLGVARTVFGNQIVNGNSEPDKDTAIHTDIIFNSTKNWTVSDGPNGAGPTDFTRVAGHEIGHALGLDHTGDPNALMWFQIGDTIGPLTDDIVPINRIYGAFANQLVALGKVNKNASDDLAVFLVDEATSRNMFYIKDGNTDTLLQTINAGTDPVLAVASVPDIGQNGNEAIAVLTRQTNGTVRTRIYNAEDGRQISQSGLGGVFSGVDLTALGDTGGGPPVVQSATQNLNGEPDIAILGVNSNGGVRVQIRDAANGSFIRNISFGSVRDALRVRVVDDLDGNGNPEIAVLSMQPNRQSRVQVRDSVTGLIVGNVFNGAFYESIDFDILDDIDNDGDPEVAVLGVNFDGKVRVQVKDIISGALVLNSFFGTNDIPKRIVAVDDVNGNTVMDFAVLLERTSDSLLRVKVKDGQTNTLIRNLTFAQAGDALDLAAVPDQDADGSPDILVLGNKDGQFRTQLKDAATGSNSNQTDFP